LYPQAGFQSHGKQSCDGIGGTVKRLVTKASLQHNFNNQILNAHSMFEFCRGNIQHIMFFFVTKDEVLEARQRMVKRFEGTQAGPGTQSYHQFELISEKKLLQENVQRIFGMNLFMTSMVVEIRIL